MRKGRVSRSSVRKASAVSVLLAVSLILVCLSARPAASGDRPAAASQGLRARHIASVPCRGSEYFDFTPLGLAFDASGRLYIVDADNSRIMASRDPFEDMRPFSDFFRDSMGVHFVDVEVRDGLTVYVSEENSGTLVGFDRLGQPRAAVDAGEGLAGFAIGYGGKTCVANPLYGFIRIVYIDGDREPVDVTLDPDAGQILYMDCLVLKEGAFVATAADRKQVMSFNAVGRYTGPFSGHEFTQPYGLASFADEYVLVTDAAEKEVVVLDMAGREIGSFGGDVLDEPAFVAVNRDGTVCVSDTGRRSIEVFRLEID
jgi:DNA-binding beta-propeller fold protein YncE